MAVLLINQGTNAAVNFDLNGTVNTQVVGVSYGTLNTLGTLPNLPGGTLGSIVGIGSVSGLSNIPGGTLNSVAAIGTVGTIGLGSVVVNTLPNIPGGTLGSIVGVGSVSGLSNLPGGSIAVTAGTIASVGTMGTLGLGTVQMTSGTLNVGTVVNNGGTVAQLTNGSIVVTAGTVAMTAGTLSPIPTLAISTFGTLGTTGASIFGTLAGGTGSGAGTEIFITSLSLSVPSTAGSQQVTIGWGSNGGTLHAGTGRLVGGNFPPGGGIQKQFYPPVNSGTNGQLMYFQAGAGTVNIDVSYFIAVSSL